MFIFRSDNKDDRARLVFEEKFAVAFVACCVSVKYRIVKNVSSHLSTGKFLSGHASFGLFVSYKDISYKNEDKDTRKKKKGDHFHYDNNMQLSFRSILCLAFDPLIFQCAPGKNRTYDLLDRNQTLYPLSYGRKGAAFPWQGRL